MRNNGQLDLLVNYDPIPKCQRQLQKYHLLNVYNFGSFIFLYYIAKHHSTLRYLHRVTLFLFHYTIFHVAKSKGQAVSIELNSIVINVFNYL